MRVFDDAGAVPTLAIPMNFKRHDRWKVIPAPDGAGGLAAELARPDGTALRALSRAWRWRQQLAAGRYGAIKALARAEGEHHAHAVKLLRLTLLAPDIVGAILSGRTDQALVLERLERPLPAS